MAEIIRQYVDGELAEVRKNNNPGRIVRFHMDEGHPASGNEIKVLHRDPGGASIVDIPGSKMAHIIPRGGCFKISNPNGYLIIIDNTPGKPPDNAA